MNYEKVNNDMLTIKSYLAKVVSNALRLRKAGNRLLTNRREIV